MKPNEALNVAIIELMNSHGRPITFPIMVNRHKWDVELTFDGRDDGSDFDGFDFSATFISPNGRRYEFYMTYITTDVEVYSRNGHLVATQITSKRIPLWILDKIDFLRDVLDEY